jgi:ABC-type multidrug transport system ATPase subunit/pSer/pThr/pTyr-binding forkhead associated (FHA) protein/ABC-type transport system involved in multi-copper enzyme maturation permease subunit
MKLLIDWDGGSTVINPGKPYVIGRDKSADIQVMGSKVSRTHLRLEFDGSNWRAIDLDSSNGSFYEGKPFSELEVFDLISIFLGGDSGQEIRLHPLQLGSKKSKDSQRKTQTPKGDQTLVASSLEGYREKFDDQTVRIRLQQRIRIGRDASNDWHIDDLTVSRFHAEVVQNDKGGFDLVDLRSANGTFINGVSVKRRELEIGDLISIGGVTRRFTSDGLESPVGIEGIDIVAKELHFSVGDRELLKDINFHLGPRSLTAIVGPSGAGKSTLLNAITGRTTPSQGQILIGGRDLHKEYGDLSQRIGLVPQADILHTRLTVKQALNYGAALRFPSDTSKAERKERVEEVMEKLELTPRADLRIDKLSGGQRKRASIGLELLTKPSILVLDEPTSGLDPGLDAHVMETLRKLADDGQTVVLVTHSVDNLNFCDNVILMASGGRIAYAGPSSTVFTALGKNNWAEVFRMLSSPEALLLSNKKRSGVVSPTTELTQEKIKKQSWGRQLITLSSRYLRVISSDRYYLGLLAAIPILIGLICYATAGELGLGSGSTNGSGFSFNPIARSNLMVLILGTVFIGLSTSIQEIIKEDPIRLREKSVGIRSGTYLMSKVLVLGVVTSIQSVIFVSIVLFNRPVPENGLLLGSGYLEILLLTVLLGFTSMCLGLLVSSVLSSPEQAMPILVGLTMGQVVLSGALPGKNEGFIALISPLVPSYWSMNSLSASVDLIDISNISDDDLEIRWEAVLATLTQSSFTVLGMSLIFLVACYMVLSKRR